MTEKMAAGSKIVLVYNTAAYLLRLRRELIKTLVSDGYDVVALVPFDSAVVGLEALGVRCIDLPMSGHSMNPLRELRTVAAMTRILRREAPDIVFCFTVKPIVYGAFASRIAGIKKRFAMITGLGLLFAGESKGAGLVRRVATMAYRKSLNRCQAVFFQNAEHRVWFTANAIVDDDAAVLVNGSGVDLDAFTAQALPDGNVRFLMTSRLLRYKGVGEYIAAASAVLRRHPELEFTLAGPVVEGPGAISTSELAAMLRDSGVKYIGELSDVRPEIAKTSVVVLPSYYPEGVPRILLEALAMGRAIITTDTPGCRTTVADGVNGMLVEPRNPDALADAMVATAGDLTRLRAMGEASRKLAVKRFDVRQVNAAILERLGSG